VEYTSQRQCWTENYPIKNSYKLLVEHHIIVVLLDKS
jgi:hypothetical protein